MSDEGGHDTRKATGQELALILDRAQFLLEILRTSELAAAPSPQVAALEDEVRALEARVAHAERQNDRLMRLYVATYQLHATLDPKEVLGNISEIVVNLVGADRFVVLLTNPAGGPASIVLRHGFDEELSERALIRFAGRAYAGGDPQVDGALAEGRLRWGEGGGSPVVAAVPLNVNGRTVGALALLRLLGHRRDLGPDDREMLDLLAAHAASALFAAQSCATAEHKLRKLAGILGPARRSA